MEYWRHIPIKNLEIIQAKTLEFLKTTNSITTTFNPLQYINFIRAVPEILTAIEGHTPVKISAYYMDINAHGLPHRDHSSSPPMRINIPILNCSNTWTRFYQLKDTVQAGNINKLDNGEHYEIYNDSDLVMVSQVEITTATIIRTHEIHSITMDEARTPRITLTMCMWPMPGLDD